jgi:transcriptional regulator with XRE-family HTH domain
MQLRAYIEQHTTVTDFARRIGKSRAQVHRYMLGKNLTVQVIEEIERATGGAVAPSDFFAAPQPEGAAAA